MTPDATDVTRRDLDGLGNRINIHESRIVNLEKTVGDSDKQLAVLQSKMDLILETTRSIGATIRNSLISLVIGAIVWVLVSMGQGGF